MAEGIGGTENEIRSTLVPLDIGGTSVYLAVQELGESSHNDYGDYEEVEISSRRPTLEQALDGLTGLARAMGARLQQTDASRVVVEFGCDFALETGTFVAVIGKASTRSSFKVGLEWEKPAPS
ncbi:CU044_2847 family protein [Streptomyces sp. NPDC004244]